MSRELPKLDFAAARLASLQDRPSKVSLADFGRPWALGGGLAEFAQRLPSLLAAQDLKEAARAMAQARRAGRTLMLAMGGHPLKVGLGPLLIDQLERGLWDSISANGSVMVHDVELALVGRTSEDVAASLGRGDFGVTAETGALIHQAAARAARSGRGLGRSLGEALLEARPPHLEASVLAAAARLDRPFTIHAALGTDVCHIHPDCDGAALGQASMDDFRTFCRLTATLEGGVFLNLGSAAIMPEVFLKALTLVRNLGRQVAKLTTVNMDFVKQYRPLTNVVERPNLEGGRGYNLIGHHEIMFPLLTALVLEQLADDEPPK
ncbi:MAG: hypothetical protein LBU12_03195 [Deltaproteobacteria bacterium]|jgi:hypothetical protein|nr:hypothetical protein [Deltaproteobacteria bacterium]